METKKIFCCGRDIFAYAKASTIVELCLSVIFNIGILVVVVLLAGLHEKLNWGPLLITIIDLACITTNTILVILELQKVSGFSIENWNLVMRIIWTIGLGKDFFRNGRNTQYALILMWWNEKSHIFPKTKYNLANLYEKASLSMSKLSTWPTLTFILPFLKI